MITITTNQTKKGSEIMKKTSLLVGLGSKISLILGNSFIGKQKGITAGSGLALNSNTTYPATTYTVFSTRKEGFIAGHALNNQGKGSMVGTHLGVHDAPIKSSTYHLTFDYVDSLSEDQLVTLGLDILRLSSLILCGIGKTNNQTKEEAYMVTTLSNAIHNLPLHIQHTINPTENMSFAYSKDSFIIELLFALDVLKDINLTTVQFAYHFKSQPMTKGFTSFDELLKQEYKEPVLPY